MKSYLFLFFTVLAVIINYTYAEDKEICDLSVVSKCCSTCTEIKFQDYGVEDNEWCSIPYSCDENIKYDVIIDLEKEKGNIPYNLRRFTSLLYSTKYSINIKVDPSSEYEWDYYISNTEIINFVSKNFTDNGTIERFLFEGNNVGDAYVYFSLHSLVDGKDHIQATLTYSFSVKKRDRVNLPTIEYKKEKEIVIEEGTTYKLGKFEESGVPGWSIIVANNTVIQSKDIYNKNYPDIIKSPLDRKGYGWITLIEGKNVGTSKLYTIYYPYLAPYRIVEYSFKVVSAEDKCFTSINNLGYPCCEGCEILYTDDDGDWGVENEDWCGIPYHCTTDINIDKKLTVNQYSSIDLPIEHGGNTTFNFYNSDIVQDIYWDSNHVSIAGIKPGKSIILKSVNEKFENYEITVTESDEISIEKTFHIKPNTVKSLTLSSDMANDYKWRYEIENPKIIEIVQYIGGYYETYGNYTYKITSTSTGTTYIDFIYSQKNKGDLLKQRYIIVVDEKGGDEDINEINFRNCWSHRYGYPCCTKTNEVLYSDSDGDWGIENGEW